MGFNFKNRHKLPILLLAGLLFSSLFLSPDVLSDLVFEEEFTVVKVEFTDSEGVALDFPHRIGITVGTHNRTQHLRAVVSPANEAVNFTITAGPKINLSNVVRTGNLFTFDIVGTGESVTRGDTSLIATHTSGPTFEHLVSVVVPKSIATPHPQPSGPVAGINRVLDATTSPGFVGLPPGQVALMTVYLQWLSIRVVDQFGDNIGDLYQGATITEYGGIPINQNLQANSTYQDPVGFAYLSAIVAAGSAQAIAWPTDPVLPMQAASTTQNIPVEVDGFSLNPAVGNRQVTATPPSTITINWP